MEGNLEILSPKLKLTEAEYTAIFALGGEDYREELTALLLKFTAITQPKILYGVFPVDDKIDDGVVINGVRIDSRLMRENFERVGRVFPYIVTCGTEAAEYAATLDDPLAEYWADEIMKRWLYKAFGHFIGQLKNRFDIKNKLAAMNPGSIKEWPLTGQRQLFNIFGGIEAVELAVGVQLTQSMLMLPSKSISGISFATDTDFVNCSRCPLITCPNRRAEYEPTLRNL